MITTSIVLNTICHAEHSTTKIQLYRQSTDKQNWSPTITRRLSHRVFTDSTEKQAVEQYETMYDNTNKPRDGNDLAALLMMIHNHKNPANNE